MTLWSDMEGEMQPLPLDPGTAERLLSGAVAPEDAPPGYGSVVRLLDAASAESSPEELAREGETVEAIVAAVRPSAPPVSTSRRSFMPFALRRPRFALAGLAAALAATAGMASAGSLPGAAQDVASDMLAKLGINVPGPNENAGDNPDVRGKSGAPSTVPDVGNGSEISELATTTELSGVEKGAAISNAASDGKSHAGENGAGAGSSTGKGNDISELATGTTATGVDKGAAISTAASGGQSQAGQHGSGTNNGGAGANNGGSGGAGGGPPVSTPNSGGTGTANTASGGASAQGTSNANQASGGASAAGSGNATTPPGPPVTVPATPPSGGGGAGNAPAGQGPPANAGQGPPANAGAAGGGNASPPGP